MIEQLPLNDAPISIATFAVLRIPLNDELDLNEVLSEEVILPSPDFVNVSPKNFLRTKERYVDGVS